ncbi:MAG: hypothetical protein IV100_19280 [Myxococcales bacterium]|nr:hypothetical protein [Myxococcales bacterium]
MNLSRLLRAAALATGIATPALAATPRIPVHGYLEEADEVPLDRAVGVTFALHTTEEGGEPVWTESRTVDFDDGAFSVYLGEQKPFPDGLFRDEPTLWLAIAVDGDFDMNRLALATAPYAAHATTCDEAMDAETLQGWSPDDFAARDHSTAWTDLIGVPADLLDGDADSAVVAGQGLVVDGMTVSADLTALQARVTGQCAAGTAASRIDADGTLVCSPLPASVASVAAGVGLTGSGTSAVTLGVDFERVQARLLGACAPGQLLRGIGDDGTPTCAADAHTTYDPGAGLQLIGTLFAVDFSAVQARVSAACPAGASIRAIDALGNITCEQDDRGLSATDCGDGAITAMNADGTARCDAVARLRTGGRPNYARHDFSGLASGARPGAVALDDGLLVAVYTSAGSVLVGRCLDHACAESAHTVIGASPSDAVALLAGAAGYPLVASVNGAGWVQLTRCGDASCGTRELQAVSAGGATGLSLTLYGDGDVGVAHVDSSASALKYSRCTAGACSTRTLLTGSGLSLPALTLGLDGQPVIAVARSTNDVVLVHCQTEACEQTSTTSLGDIRQSGAGRYPALAIGADGLPRVAWPSPDGVTVARCLDLACTEVASTPLDGGDAGRHPSLAVGEDGRPILAYADADAGKLTLSRCTDEDCTSARPLDLDTGGAWTALAVRDDGFVHALHRDATTGRFTSLRVALGRGSR